MADKLIESADFVAAIAAEFDPTHIVSMVSGGRDSAASHAVAMELGLKIDLVIHGNTRCGIPQTTEWVRGQHGHAAYGYAEADAGTAYEDYVIRKGFFGKGRPAHGFAYRILKATPFRKVISKEIRQGRRDHRVMLINGARKDESENRKKNLQPVRKDPAAPNNLWTNIIHDWTAEDRDDYLQSRNIEINPVAKALCRSGECMCGTMQSKAERVEAAAIYPKWGNWLEDLEAEARRLHGFGWGEVAPKSSSQMRFDFQPMCTDCGRAE